MQPTSKPLTVAVIGLIGWEYLQQHSFSCDIARSWCGLHAKQLGVVCVFAPLACINVVLGNAVSMGSYACEEIALR